MQSGKQAKQKKTTITSRVMEKGKLADNDCLRVFAYKSFKNTTNPNPSPIGIIGFGLSCNGGGGGS